MAQSSISPRPVPRDLPACPSDEALLAIMPGQLSGPAVDSIQAHLSTCSNCQSRITTLKRRQSATGKVSPEGAGAAPNAVEASVGQSPARAIVDSADSPLGRAAVDSSHRGTVALTTLVKVPATPPRYLADYELLRPIGRGGMGVVYKAVHTRLQRTVAIKMLSHYDDAQGVAAARLQREVIAAGRVKHPNIVFATDAGEAGGIEYLVMEYVEGLDLGKLVALVGPLPAADACEVVRQAALGLAHIEACHLVHRDLKPSNLMLADDGTVKILDLGLARMRRQTWDDEESTRSGYLLGTADYVAPEQVTDPHAADVRSDMYSLGCTFYKLLTGRAPFGGGDRKTVTSKLFAHRHVEPTPIRELRPETPDAIVDVVTRLLEKAPAARLGRPQELAAALAPLAVGSDLKALLTLACERADLDGIPSPSPSRTPPQPDAPTPPPGETPTPRRRALKQQSAAAGHRRTWLIAGGACLVLVGLVAVAFWARSKRVTLPSVIADATDPPGPQPTSLDVLPEVAPTNPLLRQPTRVILPSGAPPGSVAVDAETNSMLLSAERIQLITVGELKRGKQTVSAQFRFTEDLGDAGFFFGYREGDVGNKRVGISHLLYRQRLRDLPDGSELFRLIREQAWFPPGNAVPISFAGRTIEMAPTKSRDFELAVQFDETGIREVAFDGVPIPELLIAALNRTFDAGDLWGAWGIYNNASTVRVSQLVLNPGVKP